MMKTVTWKRSTSEPREHKVGAEVSKETAAELRRIAYERSVSVTEVVRGFILDGVERVIAERGED